MTRAVGISQRLVHVLIVMVALVPSGCGEDPDPTPRVSLTLTVTPETGRSGEPIAIRALVENLGPIPVTYPFGCTSEFAAIILIMDASGQVVRLDAPYFAPNCIPIMKVLTTGRSNDARITFDGTLWSPQGEYAAPPGLYTVRSSFVYFYPGDGHEEGDILVEIATFRWE